MNRANVRLEHDIERLAFTSRHALEHIVQLGRLAALALQLAVADLGMAGIGDFGARNFSLSTTANWSPASGVPFRPRISTGMLGPASSIGWRFRPALRAPGRTGYQPARHRPGAAYLTGSTATPRAAPCRADSITMPCAGIVPGGGQFQHLGLQQHGIQQFTHTVAGQG